MERPNFNTSDQGKALRYKNTAILISGVLFLLAFVILLIYAGVGARRDAWSYLGILETV
jgi:hypothetical protein